MTSFRSLPLVSDFVLRASDLSPERLGYFAPWPAVVSERRRLDPDSKPGKLVFNRTTTPKDTWAKIEKMGNL